MQTYSHKSYYFPSTDLPDDLSLIIGFDELEEEGYEVVSIIGYGKGVKFILKKDWIMLQLLNRIKIYRFLISTELYCPIYLLA